MRKVFLSIVLIFAALSLSAQCPWDTDQTLNPPQLALGGPYILRCPGQAIAIEVAADGTATSYSWSGPNGYTATTESITDVVTEGRYTLTASYGGTCTEVRIVEVRAKAGTPTDITLDPATITCRNGGAVTLDLSISDPLASYQWSGPDGFSAGSVPNPTTTIPGDYQVLVRDRNNCTYDLSTTIQIDTGRAQVTLQDIDLDCGSTSFTLEPTSFTEAHPGSAFRWFGRGGILFDQRGQTVTAKTPGTYLLRITDRISGCRTDANMTVNAHPDQPKFELDQAIINCYTLADTFRVDLLGCTTCAVEWTDPDGVVSTGSALPVTVPGNYSIQVENTANQCISSAESKLTFRTTPLRRTYETANVSCGDSPGKVDLLYPARYHLAEWRDSSTSEVVTAPSIELDQPATVYSHSIDRNGCEVFDTFRILQSPAPEFELVYSGDTLNCFDASIPVGVNILNYPVSEIETYEWRLPDGATSAAPQLAVDQQGIFTLQITTDLSCTSEIAEGTVPVDFTTPQVDATGGFFSCSEGGIQIQSVVDIDPLDIQWSGPNSFWSNQLAPNATRAGVYTLRITADNGCSSQDTAIVSSQHQSLAPIVISSQNIDCTNPAGAITIGSVDPGFTYTWQDLTVPNSAGTFTSSTLPISGGGIFAIEGLHIQSNCTFFDTVEITSSTTRPIVSINPLGTIRCTDSRITIESSVDAEVDYIWSTSDGEFVSPTTIANARIDGPGLYQLEVINTENQCRDTAILQLDADANDLTALEFDVVRPDCYGTNNGMINIVNVSGGIAPFQYSIAGGAFADRTSFMNLDSSEYIIVAQDATGCTFEDTVMLERIPWFEVNLSKDTTLRLGNPLTLSAQTEISDEEIGDLFWNFSQEDNCDDCAEREVVPFESGKFIVGVESELGCLVFDTVSVRVIDSVSIFVPNIFTPNGDGVNEYAEVFTGPSVEKLEAFTVFNRWGRVVYEAEDFLAGDESAKWDGINADCGVYLYTVRAISIKGEPQEIFGEITLLR